ncbi:beta-lactamase class A [Ruminiclostridium sufflavum DSM 19573]|uniref:Beta-lactamase class A n=1 Tax=Ruminiclostridium sufflavum DSM 19573 TaxID=1121337 RepID=A0A318XIP7_9FIRM|nr:serine hydrolase [Ruminiclostridium sufflavum]PYG87100.1 beta-lactamase class A [Ruminiclostridium sufflavum DSM 19573]
MSPYHMRSDKKYRRRRALVVFLSALCIIALSMAAYLIIKMDKGTGDSTKSTAGLTGENSGAAASDTSYTTAQASGSTTTAPTTGAEANIVETKAHGALPRVGTAAKSGRMDELEKLISDYTSKLPGKYGVTFIDLATGETVNINDKTEYIAASTSKLPINVLLYKKIEAGEINPEDKLVYKQEDLEYGTGSIIGTPFGTEYSVRETSKLSIQKSDNCGVNMLIRLLDIENVRNYIDEVGGQVHYGKTHRSCPYDMAQIAQDLYKLYLNNEEVYGELLSYMETTDWHDRIDAKLPKEVKVAHKIGNQTTTRNDVGIVFATHPYVLSVMNDNVNIDAATKAIAELSKKIYDFEEEYAKETK